MRRTPVLVAALASALVLVVPTVSAGAKSSAPARAQESDAGGQFVVAYAGAASTATAAIKAAGGTVLDVNAEAHIALANAADGAFATRVRTKTGVKGAARNQSIGTTNPGVPHRFAEERPAVAAASVHTAAATPKPRKEEPLNSLQWDMQMIGADANGAHKRATGRGVTVGIIDTGVDGAHPDIKPHFSTKLSRNFVTDIPDIDGPCEVPSCVDPVNADDGGHGTHVAGTIAAVKNNLGIAGVAPNATIVNVRAGQDSGFFFLYETIAALTYAGDAHLDVVNMSFFTDPWLFNCSSADDYVSGSVTPEQISGQSLARQLIIDALGYAHDRGVTLVAAAGNDHTNLGTATRVDAISPDYPLGSEGARTVTNNCLSLPSEGPHVIDVGSVGPSTRKADYSNYGSPSVAISAPGGFSRDFFGTPQYNRIENLILSTYPLHVAIAEGLADANGNPTDGRSIKSCNKSGKVCGFYTYLQGTSMASPHVAGVAALIIQAHGKRVKGNLQLDPDVVAQFLDSTATNHACPAAGFEDYTDEGRDVSFNAPCDGTTDKNGLYGAGIVNAVAAVS